MEYKNDLLNNSLKIKNKQLSISNLPIKGLAEVSKLMASVGYKYPPKSFLNVPDEMYIDAIFRHMLIAMDDMYSKDKETNILHLTHVASNCLILLEKIAIRQDKTVESIIYSDDTVVCNTELTMSSELTHIPPTSEDKDILNTIHIKEENTNDTPTTNTEDIPEGNNIDKEDIQDEEDEKNNFINNIPEGNNIDKEDKQDEEDEQDEEEDDVE